MWKHISHRSFKFADLFIGQRIMARAWRRFYVHPDSCRCTGALHWSHISEVVKKKMEILVSHLIPNPFGIDACFRARFSAYYTVLWAEFTSYYETISWIWIIVTDIEVHQRYARILFSSSSIPFSRDPSLNMYRASSYVTFLRLNL